MHFVFLLTIAVGAAYFLFVARRFDFLSVFFFAGVLYSFHAIVGYFPLDPFTLVYTTKAYVIIVSFFIVLLIGTVAHDVIWRGAGPPRGLEDSGVRDHLALVAIGGVLLGAGSLAGVILHDPQLMLAEPSKPVMLAGMNYHLYSWYSAFALQAILAAYLSRRPFILAAAAVLGLIDLWLGFRFVVTMSALGILVAEGQRSLKPLYRRWILCALGATAAVSMIVVKRLYDVIKTGNWLQTPDLINEYVVDDVLRGAPAGELMGPAVLFLGGLGAGVDLGYQHVVSAARCLVPFLGRFGGEFLTYNDYVQGPVLGLSDRTGYANSNFGSWHAVGGTFGVIFFSCCYTGLVIFLASLMRRARLSCPLYLAWLPILTFYNFRNDFYHMFSYSRQMVTAWFLLMAFAAVVLACRPSRRAPIQPGAREHPRMPALLRAAPCPTRASPSPG